MLTKLFFSVLILFCLCSSQHQIVTESSQVTVCWDMPDTGGSYSVFWRNYSGVDTTWKALGVVDTNFIIVDKGTKKEVIFGVRWLIDGDESDMHTSLDTTACFIADSCMAACDSTYSWYLDWNIAKPTAIKVFSLE